MLAVLVVIRSPLQGVGLAVSLLVGVLVCLLVAPLFAMPRRIRRRIALYRATLESTADGILVLGRDNRIVRFNDRCAELLEIPPAVLARYEIGPVLLRALRRAADPAALLARLRALGAEPAATGSAVIEFADGRVVECHARPQYLDGVVIGKVWSFRDHTDRWRAEVELRRSEERFRALLENVWDSIVLIDAAGVIHFSASAETVGGYRHEDLIGRNVLDLLHPEDRGSAEQMLAGLVEVHGARVATEIRFLHADGSWRVGEVIAQNLLGHPAVRGIVINTHDITERKRVEEELEVQRAYFAELFESAPEAIVLVDEHDRVLRANQEFTRTFGYTIEEVVGRPAADLIIPAELRDEALAITERVAVGEKVSLETVRRRKDGVRVPVSILATAIRAPGKGLEIYGIYRDITGRKQLEEQLLQSQKIEAVGRLAGGIAHDFNNLLTAIRGHTSFLMEEIPTDAPWRSELGEIDRAAGRAASLTRQLLAFSRKQILNPRVVDLNALILGMEKLLRRLIGEDIALVAALSPGECRVKADPGQLEQVLLNLVVNARDAMPAGGRIVVETRPVPASVASAPASAAPAAGGYALLAVRDNGQGMDEQTRERIFEPFFTTKGPGEGTGLGLSTVYGIVEQSGGWLRVESEVGRGTTMSVFLPWAEEAVEAPPAPARQGEAAGRGETVLLVEDDGAVRALARRILERQGYRLLAAGTGEEAIQLATHHDGALDLLLTDVVMPGMSGRELAERLTAERPGLGVLFMSGYTEDDVLRRGIFETGTSFLGKPFTPDVLARRVREVLERRSA
jgi:PAS domain S-box-containing protein